MTQAIRDENHVTVALGVSSTDNTVTLPLQIDPATGRLKTDSSGGGYTNLTQFVDQTAWRLFYSNPDGDVIEFAFGASGEVFTSGGASANPTWETAGAGDFKADGSVPMTGDFNAGGNNLDNVGVAFLIEQAAADADVVGSGQIWVKTATPNQLWFTDDAGTDFQLGVGAIAISGTPANNQLAIWTDAATVEGDSGLTFDGTDLTTTGIMIAAAFEPTGDTAAADNAAVGYTAAEGLILTGQGSTSDVTLKNDADAAVLSIPTGTNTIVLGVDGTVSSLILTEKASIALDPAGGADGDYSGVTVTGTGGATIAFGEPVYLKTSDSEWYLTDASAVTTAGDLLIGICVLASTNGNPITVLLQGIIRADAVFPTFTIGGQIFLSETAGDLTQTKPTTTDAVVQSMGFAMTANEIYFNPSVDYMTHV